MKWYVPLFVIKSQQVELDPYVPNSQSVPVSESNMNTCNSLLTEIKFKVLAAHMYTDV